MSHHVDRQQLRQLWEQALREDGAQHDVTSMISTLEQDRARALLIAKQKGVFAGQILLSVLQDLYGQQLTVTGEVADGDALLPHKVIATLIGPFRLLLGIERTLLNFLQRLSGVATLTRHYVDAVAGTRAKIYDTRKTLPGWRQLDKYAVRCGGGHNHRMGLHDAILVKDNHLAGVPVSGLAAAASDMLDQATRLRPPPGFVEFEVDTLEQFDELLKVVGIDVILVDNFRPDQIRDAVARRDARGLKDKVALEASGGVDLARIRMIAETGVDRIAVGTITHSAPALDMAMEITSLMDKSR